MSQIKYATGTRSKIWVKYEAHKLKLENFAVVDMGLYYRSSLIFYFFEIESAHNPHLIPIPLGI